MRGLYAIVDVGTLSGRGIDPVRFAEAVLEARPAALQVRAKNAGAREALGLLRAIARSAHNAKVPLVANDRADLAAFAGCDMVHVGQDDIAIDLVRRIAPGLGVGISTHTPAQLAAALATRPTYVAYGPVFATSSKHDAAPAVGLEGLREAARMAKSAGVPLVAIGGITTDRAVEVAEIVECAAVIGALVPPARAGEVTDDARAAFPSSVTSTGRHRIDVAELTMLREVNERARALQAIFAHTGSLQALA